MFNHKYIQAGNHRDFKFKVSLNLNVLCVHMILILMYVYNLYLCPCDRRQAHASLTYERKPIKRKYIKCYIVNIKLCYTVY